MKTRAILAALALAGLTITPAWAEEKKETEFKGVIDKMPAAGTMGEWIISGRQVLVNDKTKLDSDDKQQLVVGQKVEVEGKMDGVIFIATEIDAEEGK